GIFWQWQIKPARTESVAGRDLSARGFDRMSDAITPFRLRIVRARVGNNLEVSVGGRSEFKSDLSAQLAAMGREVMFRPAIMVSFGVEVSVFDIDTHSQTHVGFRWQIDSHGGLTRWSREP